MNKFLWWMFPKHEVQAIGVKISNLDRKIEEIEQRLTERLVKLERIERFTANVAREKSQRPKNWTQFRTLAEGAEEPNARG